MRRRLRELAVLVAVGGLMMAGCSSSDKKASVTDAQGKNVAESQSQDEGSKKVTFVLKSLGSNYWVQLKAGAVDKAEELGIDLEVLAPSSDNATEDQIRMLEDQVVSGVDLVLVAPSNSGAQVATFDKVVDAGIPLICVDTNAKDYDKNTWNAECGKRTGTDRYRSSPCLFFPKVGSVFGKQHGRCCPYEYHFCSNCSSCFLHLLK